MIYVLMACMPLAVTAQKKAISQARTYVKGKKENELVKAEQMMNDLLRDSANRQNEKIWLILADAVHLQYVQGNEKLYLKQKYDTTRLFTTASKLFRIYEAFDSVEMKPNAKGKVEIKYRAKHSDILNAMRPNIYNGAAFALRKQDYKSCLAYSDQYVDCAYQPIFADYHYLDTDTLLPNAAYWALFSAYKLNNLQAAVKHQKMAEEDSSRFDNIQQYIAELQLAHGDTAQFVASLERGFNNNPTHSFFFPRIVDYYNAKGMVDSAAVFIDNALASDSTNTLFLFAKSSALLNSGDYQKCIEVTQKLLERADSMPEAYCNMGLAYYNQAVALDRTMQRSRKKRKSVNELYAKSKPYMEEFRKLAPAQQSKWVPALYTIYLNLNMGKEFEEIDAIRQKMNL